MPTPARGGPAAAVTALLLAVAHGVELLAEEAAVAELGAAETAKEAMGVGVSAMKKTAGFYSVKYLNEVYKIPRLRQVCKANTKDREIHFLSICCTSSTSKPEDWIVSTTVGGRPQLYARGVGIYPGGYTDAGEVAMTVGADPNSRGDYAIAAERTEKVALENKEPLRPPETPSPPPEPKHDELKIPVDGGNLVYLGCYSNHGNRDLVWGPNQDGFDAKTCYGSCPEFKYIALGGGSRPDQGMCTCDNTYHTPKTTHKKLTDLNCHATPCGKYCGSPGANAVYSFVKTEKKLPCRDVRRRRRLQIQGLTDKGVDGAEMSVETDDHDDYKGAFACMMLPNDRDTGESVCKARCHDIKFCGRTIWSCATPTGGGECACKLFRYPGAKKMKDGVPDCQTTCKDEKDNDSESNQHDSHGVGGEKAKQFGPSARQLLTVYDKREDGSMHKTFTGPSARRLTAYDEEEHEATAFMSDPNGENDLQVGDSWSPYEAAKNAKIKVPNPFADRRRRAKTPPPPKPPPHKCRMFEYKPRKKGFLPKLPVGPPPPPMVPPNPAHCGGDPSLKQPAATKAVDLANNAAKMAAAAAEPPPPPPQHYKKGEFAGDKEIVKFNHATFNSEDIVGGCQIASETGRRKIEISVVKLGKTALADINFTFMKMTVCKHKTCERRAEILDCSIQYKTFNLEKPEDPPKLEAKEDCDDAAVDAATAAT